MIYFFFFFLGVINYNNIICSFRALLCIMDNLRDLERTIEINTNKLTNNK